MFTGKPSLDFDRSASVNVRVGTLALGTATTPMRCMIEANKHCIRHEEHIENEYEKREFVSV